MNRVAVLSQQVLPPTKVPGASTGLAAAVTAAKGDGKTAMHVPLAANSNFIGELHAGNVDLTSNPKLESLMQGKQSAIIIHGNSLDDCKGVDEWVKKALGMPIMPTYTLGAAPRDKVSGDTYTATYADWDVPITPHSEMGYAIERPHVLVFSCVKRGKYGQTFVVNTEGVLEDAMQRPNLRRYFESGLLRVDRVFLDNYKWDLYFGSKEQAIQHMRKQGYKVTEDGDNVLVSFVMRHVERDAKGNRCSGFLGNFDQGTIGLRHVETHMHGASKELNRDLEVDLEEYIQAAFRTGDTGGDAGNRFTQTFLDINGSDLELTTEDAKELSDLIRKHMEFVQWQEGDIVLIDNKRVMHGRLPRDPKVERDVRVALVGPYQVETSKEALEGAQVPSVQSLLNFERGEQSQVAGA